MTIPIRNLVVALLIVAAANLVVLPFADRLAGLSVDVLFLLRDRVFGPRHDTQSSPTVVIAIDEETYRRPPFRSLPKVMWSNEIATVLDAVFEGGAKVVGFDVIFPTSVEQKLRGHDRKLLITLRRASQSGRVVLGKVQHQQKPISPFAGYSFAVGHQRNIRPLNLLEDDDGVIRRLPLYFRSRDLRRGERRELSMALEIASRMVDKKPRFDSGTVTFNGQAVPYVGPGPLINFDGGAGWIPSYSLADLYACASRNNKDYFRRHFAGKAIFLGAVLDVEDRKLTSRRFIGTPDGVNLPERCVYPPMKGLYRTDVVRDSIPGVYLHATGVNMLVRNDTIDELGKAGRRATVLVLTVLTAIAAFVFSPVSAAVSIFTGAVAWVAAATAAFQMGFSSPVLHPIAVVFLSFGAIVAYRFGIADKDRNTTSWGRRAGGRPCWS